MKKSVAMVFTILIFSSYIGCGNYYKSENVISDITETTEQSLQSDLGNQSLNTQTGSDQTDSMEISSDKYNIAFIKPLIEKWADAFCKRDGNGLYQLFNPNKKEEFFQLKYVNSSKENSYIDFGDFNLWPKLKFYELDAVNNEADIIYYVITEEQHVYVWIEKLKVEEVNGEFYVSSEELMEYKSITSKAELMESVRGNYQYYRNGLNYNLNGLGYQLNQQAVNKKTGVYASLFKPETAAPYLLNLTGGKSTIKAQYKTSVIVSYQFEDGENLDIQMTQPFGSNGIWLVEDIDVEAFEENIQEMNDWYENLTLADLNQAKAVTTPSDLDEVSDEALIQLASIPEENITMYGYRNQAVILRKGNNYQYFNWTYLAPVRVIPRMGYGDYDNDGEKELAVSVHIGSGTGVSVDRLYLVKIQRDGTMQAMEFTPYQYSNLLNDRITTDYDKQNKILQFSIDGKKSGESIDISQLTDEGSDFTNIDFGQQIVFIISKEEITLDVIPECYLEGRVTPEYDKMPHITAKVVYSEGSFGLSDFVIGDKTE